MATMIHVRHEGVDHHVGLEAGWSSMDCPVERRTGGSVPNAAYWPLVPAGSSEFPPVIAVRHFDGVWYGGPANGIVAFARPSE